MSSKISLLAAFLVVFCSLHLAGSEFHIQEYNLIELTKDSFYKVVHDITKHVVVELYSSESWCGKYGMSKNKSQNEKKNHNFQFIAAICIQSIEKSP